MINRSPFVRCGRNTSSRTACSPPPGILRDYVDALKAETSRDGSDLVFGRSPELPFTPSVVQGRADRAWHKARVATAAELAEADGIDFELLEDTAQRQHYLERAGYPRWTLHEGRHTYVTWMFAAGFSLEAIWPYVGHSSTYMTEHYRQLLDGHEDATRKQVDEYLARANTADRIRQLGEASTTKGT